MNVKQNLFKAYNVYKSNKQVTPKKIFIFIVRNNNVHLVSENNKFFIKVHQLYT